MKGHLFELSKANLIFGDKGHGLVALRDLNLRILSGERVALVGANGCGKSSLLRVLHGLEPLTSGSIVSKAMRQAMLFQRPHLMRMTVQSNVALGLWIKKHPWDIACSMALDILIKMDLGDLAQRQARKLSGGQQQRVAMARALAINPQVLFLDEPTSSLDPHAKREVESLIGSFSKVREIVHGQENEPMTLIFSSHNLGQVKRLASRVIYLEKGCVLADLPVEHFFDHKLLEANYPEANLFLKGELV